MASLLSLRTIKETSNDFYKTLSSKLNLNALMLDKRQLLAISSKYNTKIILIGSLVIIVTGSTLLQWLRMRRYFRKLNIEGPAPKPLIGNLFDLMGKGFGPYDDEIRNTYGGICGYFEGPTPVILISDPKLIKAITIKDSASFVNRRVIEGVRIEPFVSMLSAIKDDEWKNARSIVTTSFTSAKLKEMSKLIVLCAKAVNGHLEKLANENKEFDVREVFGSLTLDVISSCLFGFETNSIQDPNNEFIKNLKTFFGTTLSPKFAFLFMFPALTQWLAERNLFNLIPKECMDFLTRASSQVIARRRQRLEVRNDFIQNMIDHEQQMNRSEFVSNNNNNTESVNGAKWAKPLKKTLSDKEILAQTILFLAAGYETTASTIGFLAYHLSQNPECQNTLIEEIDRVLEKHNGEISYESIAEMTYLEMCINETLRICPPAYRTDRVCNQDYKYGDVKIPNGQVVAICIWAVHHDPNIYPDPYKFMPERFSEEQKSLRDNESFIPFGSGQRNCVGMRFALIEIKLFLAEFFSRMYFIRSENTPEKLTFNNGGILRTNENVYLKAKKRF